jgi:hypothetical protein
VVCFWFVVSCRLGGTAPVLGSGNLRETENQSQLYICLWQPAQPERAMQANLKAACNPKGSAQEVIVYSNHSTTTTKQKTTQPQINLLT